MNSKSTTVALAPKGRVAKASSKRVLKEKRVRQPSLTDRAYRILEEQIVTLQLEPGTVTSEALLSELLGIGRMPVREALQQLARERLVQILPQRGVVVSEINVLSQFRLLEVRREMERLLARSAARRATPAQRSQFARIAQEMSVAAEKNDDILFLRMDREFNNLVMDAARNEFATSAMSLMNGLSRRFWFRFYRQFADLPLSARLHAAVAEEIAQGREAEAVAASDALIDYMEGLARSTVTADS